MSTVLLTGVETGFGRLISLALAEGGHTVYATLREPDAGDAPFAASLRAASAEAPGQLRPLELDVRSQRSADAAVGAVIADQGALDVVIHNEARLVTGVTEAFSPEEIAAVFDVNVLGAHRVNRAALPHLREHGSGLVVWIGSATSRGGHPPFRGPYVATKAAGDLLAQTYAYELIRFGIETTIVALGRFGAATEPAEGAGRAADAVTAAAYARYDDVTAGLDARLEALRPADVDPRQVGDEVARIVDLPAGRRPFRVVIDPSEDGAAEVTEVAERVRVAFAHRAGIEDLLPSRHRQAGTLGRVAGARAGSRRAAQR